MIFKLVNSNWKISSLIFYIVVSIVWWFSLIQNFGSKVIGLGGDPYQSLWRFLRFSQVVVHGSLTIPEESVFKNFAPIPWLPLEFMFGEVVAYNLVWFLTGILAAWFTFLLTKSLGARNFPSFIAGLLILFSPFRLSQALGHFGAMQLWWIPAATYFFIKWQRSSSKKWLVLSLICLVGLSWSEHHFFLAYVFMIIIAFLFYFQRILKSLNKNPIVYLFLIIAIVAALYPFYSSVGSLVDTSGSLNLGQEQRERYSATLKSFVSIPSFSVFKNLGFGNSENNVSDHTFYLGTLLPLLAFIVFLRKRRKVNWLIGLGILLMVVLTIGPVLKVRNIEVLTPVYLLQNLPILSSIRAYGRFMAIPVLFLPILLAINWPKFGKRFSLILGILLLLEIMPQFSFPTMNAKDESYEKIYAEAPVGKILAIPASTNYLYASKQLYWSAKQGRELADSIALERIIDKNAREIFLQTPVVRDLALLRIKDFYLPSFFGQDVKVSKAAFASQNIGSVIFDSQTEGGVISYAESKPHKTSNEEILSVRDYLKESLGLKENEISKGIYFYPVEGEMKEQILGIKGDKWELLNKNGLREDVNINPGATFHVYSLKDSKFLLSFNILANENNSTITFAQGDLETKIKAPQKGQVDMVLSAKKGFNEYSIKLDGGKLKVENPKIQGI